LSLNILEIKYVQIHLIMKQLLLSMSINFIHNKYKSSSPSAISHQPSAISHQPSAISHQPSAISIIMKLF
jgi:hypothetical protein